MSTFPDFDTFAARHIGLSPEEVTDMLGTLDCADLGQLIDQVVPSGIRMKEPLNLPWRLSEVDALARLRTMMDANVEKVSFIGRGYHDTITPAVIQRNILENPGWYTAYTPYQAEISQGRLEALLNFQTMICELTAMPVANASLLDEATAAAEAMMMCSSARRKGTKFFVDRNCFSQTIAVLKTRAEPIGVELLIGDPAEFDFAAHGDEFIGILLQYPGDNGAVTDFSAVVEKAHAAGGFVVVAADLLALAVLKPPGEWGADIVVGSAQRFGVPLGYGGPHAGYISCSEAHKRRLPGRLIGVSKDADGRPALRLSLQTREQHIRREKATSNICTAQVLLAVMAGFYAVYHGPRGLNRIANRVQSTTSAFAAALQAAGFELENGSWFDTLTVQVEDAQRQAILERAEAAGINLRIDLSGRIGVSFDEVSTTTGTWRLLGEVFGVSLPDVVDELDAAPVLPRESGYLTQGVFHRFHTEHEILRYIRRLEGKDIALNWSMIPLGSCTMKLNATSEMLPLSWSSVGHLHPFAPAADAAGYREMIDDLEASLAEITGFSAVSFQPNAGSQGEFAGLLAIRRFHESCGDTERTVCLIPMSAHGTNPASAVMAGFSVVPVICDEDGNIDVEDIRKKAGEHAEKLGALMITYPSTHGVFEETVVEIGEIIHANGGQVYMDGANMNAQVGLCRPGDMGADVCHLNLHKTFCIPHGGGGPGVGPIGVAEHLVPFLPGHVEILESDEGVVSAAPYGSASILTISWMYVAMMGGEHLAEATRVAILNANYIAARLKDFFPVLYKGRNGRVAHECIIDVRPLKEETGIDVEDIAKRLIDFGYHAPTMSWPVPGTLMIEPTESESKEELDRFCDAMIAIHSEIIEVKEGSLDGEDNPLKHAPHPAENTVSDSWSHAYSREKAAYPLEWVRARKFWPSVSRIDNVFGDRNLVCTCEGMDALLSESDG